MAGASRESRRFQILRRLGEGGMGVVYEALDSRLGAPVALKTLRAAGADLLYQFKNEFRSLADLHHPNLIDLYELFSEGGEWYFTMEIVRGEPFDEYVRQGPPAGSAPAPSPATPGGAPTTSAPASAQAEAPAPERATLLGWGPPGADAAAAPARWNGRYDEGRLRRCLAQLAAGISALHAAGVIHRDIKPTNVLVGEGERVVVMDFGLAADAELMEEWVARARIAGTPSYMAPEQTRPGAAVGGAADWYALGAMLYEILAGYPPHDAGSLEATLALKETEPPPLASLGLHPPPPADLARLAESLLAPDPAARPGGAEILAALGARETALAPSGEAGDFVGRERELAALREAYREAADSAVTAFVEGPSGVGKTALVEELVAGARAQGALVLRGRCHAEESVPYNGFDGVIDALSRALTTLGPEACDAILPEAAPEAARIFPVLTRAPGIAAPASGERTSAVELRRRAFDALAAIFWALGRLRRVVVFIDDLQWADADSLLLLRELLSEDASPPLLLVASIRPEGRDARALASQTGLSPRYIPVGPLSEEDALVLLGRIAPELEADRRRAIIREAGGHPLFLAELAQCRLEAGAGLDDALWDRTRRLPRDARRVLDVAAVAGAPLDAATLAAAAGSSPAEGMRLAARLRSERLVKHIPTPEGAVRVEPYHDRVREALTARFSADRLADLSGRLAGALLSAGVGETAPELVVRHLTAAGEHERAAEFAEAAAERARGALAFDRAAEFFRAALHARGRDPAEARRLNIQLAEALASAGRGGEAAEAFLAAGERAGEETALECRRRAAEQLLASGHIGRGLEELEGVMAALGESVPNTPADALAALETARAELDRFPFPGELRGEKDVDRALLRRLDACQATSIGLILVDNVRGADFQARALRLALEAREPRRLSRALLLEGVYRAQEGEGGRRYARGMLEAAARVAEGRGDAWMDGYLVFAKAWITYYEGRFKRSVERFAEADAIFRELPGVAWERNTILIHRLRATDYQGAWGELRPLYEEYLRDAKRRDDRYVQASLKRWFNVLWLARDRPDLAGEDLDASPWTTPEEGRYHLQHFLELRARVELALYRGQGASQGSWAYAGLDAAERSLLFRIQIAKAIGDWLRGRIAACEGNAAYVEAMVGRLADENIAYASIWGGLLAGAARVLRGAPAAAIEILGATAELADDTDFPLCAHIARLRAAELAGDGAARERALAWMRDQDIENPEAMADVFAPGFSGPRR